MSSSMYLSTVRVVLEHYRVSWAGAHSREPRIGQKLDFFKAVNPATFLGKIITHYW